ncbi:hypothetical protein [Legionella micdadei]|uniref:Chaperone protein DnaJ n=1 Tax=Legionella micdadei TaxID=451 RepID=A0A098GHI1_LEGMI|nr:hypothetical protein [Legionella micdadei]KTD27570.1 hypothetical protein Lmic_1890 [Legionella micdadei]CEG60941.1 protein of unknown function [Legionella micdadei]SCY69270.1 hypothetical protein SAMN02982997_02512 [Legionella micdadei]
MLCYRCKGTGKYFGNGMIQTDCDKCDGYGNSWSENDSDNLSHRSIDKRSKAYKDAIKDIMKLDPKISRQEAEKMFQKTYDKI